MGENITTHHTRERDKKRNQKFHAEQYSFKLHEKMNNKIVLAFAIVVVGIIVDCGSSETQYEDAVEREAIQELNDYLAGNKEVNDDELQQAINQLRPQRLKTMNGGTQVLREAEGPVSQPRRIGYKGPPSSNSPSKISRLKFQNCSPKAFV